MSARTKTETRARARERLMRAAAGVPVPARADVVVCGGGAAGLAAGIVAAESGARVLVVERELECGRPILATGNGRCNLSNAELSFDHYNQPAFVGAVAGPDFGAEVARFFAESGLATRVEDGRVYPVSNQAASVREVLLARAARSGVVCACGREVTNVRVGREGLVVECSPTFEGAPASIEAPSVVVATGGGALAALDGLGLGFVETRPVLAPLACEPRGITGYGRLDGRRARARLVLSRDGQVVAGQSGEVLFRTYGLSGIVAFDLSRLSEPGDVIAVDLLAGADAGTVARARELGCAAGVLDPTVAEALGGGVAAIDAARSLEFEVAGIADARQAQVTRGGLDCRLFSTETLESMQVAGLFACGEALDVDGACGGFNLAWAWRSGQVAGDAAARKGKCR